jgi:hypothetical protein
MHISLKTAMDKLLPILPLAAQFFNSGLSATPSLNTKRELQPASKALIELPHL